MGSHIVIGGSARCGKSTVARSVRHTLGPEMQTLSGDAVRNMLRRTVPKGLLPILHGPRAEKIPDEEEFIAHHSLRAATEVASKRRQAEFVWPFLETYAREIDHESGEGVIVESIDVWPDLLAASSLCHKAVFLVDTSKEQADRIIASRHTDPYDWMHQNGYSDRRIRAWCEFNVMRSEAIRELARAADYMCIDLAEVTFGEAQQVAHDYLCDVNA